jgi:hypothetical protein
LLIPQYGYVASLVCFCCYYYYYVDYDDNIMTVLLFHRVSFGSSKGSMVETLIYESPLQEEPEASPILEGSCAFPADGENAE